MGCKVHILRSGKLCLRLQWVLHGRSIRSQESLDVKDTARGREIATRDFVVPIEAAMRGRRFDESAYLDWFPSGSKSAEFRRRLGGQSSTPAAPPATIGEYFARWISRIDSDPDIRLNRKRDYRQALTCYVLETLADVPIRDLSATHLADLRQKLREKPLSHKTVRNIIDSSFRALYRDAIAEEVALQPLKHPFETLAWQRVRAGRAKDPFTQDERDTIIESFASVCHGHYQPFVLTQFLTGMRPSESTALRVSDIDLELATATINKSRNLGEESSTKTTNSERTIDLHDDVVEALRPLVEGRHRDEHLFLNRDGNPVDASNFGKAYWAEALKAANVRHRVFYNTRHTFISLALSNGGDAIAVAAYTGTSLAMLHQTYAKWIKRDRNAVRTFINGRAKTQPAATGLRFAKRKAFRINMSPTGFEPVLPT